MPEQPRLAAVQAHYLLAAAAFTLEGDPHYGGVKIEQHPAAAGALVSSTTGKQIAVIHDGHGICRGPGSFWVIPTKALAKELKKIEDSTAGFYGDVWALMTWTGSGTGSIQLIEADSGAQALDGNGKLVKTILRDSDGLVLLGQVPVTLENIRGATAMSRDFAPNRWFLPRSMARVEQFAQALTNSYQKPPAGISFLRTKRDNMVQVVFRDHEEALVFLATVKSEGEIQSEDPSWLAALV